MVLPLNSTRRARIIPHVWKEWPSNDFHNVAKGARSRDPKALQTDNDTIKVEAPSSTTHVKMFIPLEVTWS